MEVICIYCNEENYSKRLLNIKNYPKELFYAGNIKLLNSKKMIAIVGSRDCTEYGEKYAKIFAKELAKKGICIISGLAEGIDSAVHFESMKEIGKTIAVLGSGINKLYPIQNKWLYEEIIENGGCVISEYSNDTTAQMSNFPKRDRIISGCSDATIVIESKHRSGSKITARYAKEQGKKVYCIPCSLDNKNGTGVNELIQEGAMLITSPQQVIDDLYKTNNKQLISNDQMKI